MGLHQLQLELPRRLLQTIGLLEERLHLVGPLRRRLGQPVQQLVVDLPRVARLSEADRRAVELQQPARGLARAGGQLFVGGGRGHLPSGGTAREHQVQLGNEGQRLRNAVAARFAEAVAPKRREDPVGVLARVVAVELGEHATRSRDVVEQRGGAGAVVLNQLGAAGRGLEPLVPELGQGAQERPGHELRRRNPGDAAGEILAGRRLLGEQFFGRHGQSLL
ncbi:MAG: hypothetical protein DMG09_03935 [Acidobacteria bacterium]|nr:MAG: hypothetical protein DMG09_03935 [Acidobacteriota bacterium]